MNGLPLVSVLLPVRQEAAGLEATLETVFAQTYPAERLEVIVAEGRSTDGTRPILERLAAAHPQLRLVDNPAGIVPTGLNAALQVARGDIVVRVDGHTRLAPDYVAQCVQELERTGAANVGGRMRASGHGPFGQAVALATSSPFGVGGARFHYAEQETWTDTVYLGAWRRETFDRIGLFDEELVRDQDDEFNYRLREHGGRILLSPRLHSEYTVRGRPGALWRQYFQYGFWKVRVMQKHWRQMRLRQFVPPLFVLALLLTALAAVVLPAGRWLFAAVAGSYVAANLAASVWTGARHGWAIVVRLPVVYAILHLSYGWGVLTGLVRFAGRWGDRRGRVPTLHTSSRGT